MDNTSNGGTATRRPWTRNEEMDLLRWLVRGGSREQWGRINQRTQYAIYTRLYRLNGNAPVRTMEDVKNVFKSMRENTPSHPKEPTVKRVGHEVEENPGPMHMPHGWTYTATISTPEPEKLAMEPETTAKPKPPKGTRRSHTRKWGPFKVVTWYWRAHLGQHVRYWVWREYYVFGRRVHTSTAHPVFNGLQQHG